MIAFNDSYKWVTKSLCYYVIRMSQSVHNDEKVPIEDDIDQGQRVGDQVSHIMPTNLE